MTGRELREQLEALQAEVAALRAQEASLAAVPPAPAERLASLKEELEALNKSLAQTAFERRKASYLKQELIDVAAQEDAEAQRLSGRASTLASEGSLHYIALWVPLMFALAGVMFLFWILEGITTGHWGRRR
jgi:predicted nuclease with TOPRIM domain